MRRCGHMDRCRTCHAEFFSRNQLFEHLREQGHFDDSDWRKDVAPKPHSAVTTHTLPLLIDPTPAAPIERVDLFEDGRAFVLRNVLSTTECIGYISAATALGMQSVQADDYARDVRICRRVVATSEGLASRLFQRIAPFLAPVDLTGARPSGIPADRMRTVWRPHGLNELFRICSYQCGGHFVPHLDGGHTRSKVDASMQTFMLYLNSSDEFEGGRTRFFDETQRAYRAPDPAKVVCTYVPQRGDALIFNSALMHDGEALQGGEKWIMRSEVMHVVQPSAKRGDDQGPPAARAESTGGI